MGNYYKNWLYLVRQGVQKARAPVVRVEVPIHQGQPRLLVEEVPLNHKVMLKEKAVQNFISSGNHFVYEFNRGDTPVDFVEFDAKRTLGKITTTVEQLKGRSSLANIDPQGKVIK